MRKVSFYVFDEIEGALDKVLADGKDSLSNWLWDHNLEVVNVIEEEDFDENEALKTEDESEEE